MDGDSGTYLSRVGSLSRIMEIMDTSLGTKRTDDSLKHEVNNRKFAMTEDAMRLKNNTIYLEGLDNEEKVQWSSSKRKEGDDFFGKGDYTQATQVYLESLLGLYETQDDDQKARIKREIKMPTLSNMAVCALKMKEYAKAKALCDEVLTIDPENVRGLCLRSLAFMNMEIFQEARDDITSASKLATSDKESRDIDIYEQQLRSCMKKVSLEKDKHKKFYQQGARRLQENKPLNGEKDGKKKGASGTGKEEMIDDDLFKSCSSLQSYTIPKHSPARDFCLLLAEKALVFASALFKVMTAGMIR